MIHMGATVALRNSVLDKILRNVDFTVAEVHISLHTADPGDTGADEVTGGSYARQGPAAFDAAASALADNTNAVEFVDMPAATVTHFGLFDAASGGTFLWGGALDSSVTTTAGDTARFDAGDLDVTIT